MAENPQRTDKPIGDLLQQASQQTATLVRQEMRLAQLEIKEKGRHAGIGAGLLGGGGVMAFLALGALTTAAIAGLSLVLPVWAAALIVGVILFPLAGVLALAGKKQIDRAQPPKPERGIDSAQHDVAEVRERGSR
jgi:Putative Actinobacterial Holin-X, holin superfamily III